MPKIPKPAWEYLPAWMGPFVPAIKTFTMAVGGAAFGAVVDAGYALATGEGPQPWSRAGFHHMANVGTTTAVAAAYAYLRHSPQPRKEWSEEERLAHQEKLAAQGRLTKTPPPPPPPQ